MRSVGLIVKQTPMRRIVKKVGKSTVSNVPTGVRNTPAPVVASAKKSADSTVHRIPTMPIVNGVARNGVVTTQMNV
jgi:hypothetical protein